MAITSSVLDQTSGMVLVGEGGESLPTQDKKEVPVGGKGIEDEAVWQKRTEKKKEGTKEKGFKKYITHRRNNAKRTNEF